MSFLAIADGFRIHTAEYSGIQQALVATCDSLMIYGYNGDPKGLQGEGVLPCLHHARVTCLASHHKQQLFEYVPYLTAPQELCSVPDSVFDNVTPPFNTGLVSGVNGFDEAWERCSRIAATN